MQNHFVDQNLSNPEGNILRADRDGATHGRTAERRENEQDGTLTGQIAYETTIISRKKQKHDVTEEARTKKIYCKPTKDHNVRFITNLFAYLSNPKPEYTTENAPEGFQGELNQNTNLFRGGGVET